MRAAQCCSRPRTAIAPTSTSPAHPFLPTEVPDSSSTTIERARSRSWAAGMDGGLRACRRWRWSPDCGRRGSTLRRLESTRTSSSSTRRSGWPIPPSPHDSATATGAGTARSCFPCIVDNTVDVAAAHHLMIRHFLWIAAITVLALAGMFYPFMPGTYDRMAIPLSGIIQVMGLAGLLLVPIGMVWLVYELVNRRRRLGPPPQEGKSHWFAVCALAALLVVGAGVAPASIQTGPSLAVCLLILCVHGIWRAAPAVSQLMPG